MKSLGWEGDKVELEGEQGLRMREKRVSPTESTGSPESTTAREKTSEDDSSQIQLFTTSLLPQPPSLVTFRKMTAKLTLLSLLGSSPAAPGPPGATEPFAAGVPAPDPPPPMLAEATSLPPELSFPAFLPPAGSSSASAAGLFLFTRGGGGAAEGGGGGGLRARFEGRSSL